MKLLTRDEFRTGCFQRDDNSCVVCTADGQDAHHIIERRLWSDGGYYLDNGATLCGPCHLLAEQTVITPEQLWKLIGAKRCVPPDWYDDVVYDKWGNIVLSNGTRLKGPLFDDVSVQRIIPAEIKATFRPYVKYPRTSHLPWSPGRTDDDRSIPTLEYLEAADEIVVTEKLDGENTTMYSDYIHARSLDSRHHPSRNWVKNFHATIKHDIPDGWRLCGENLYAVHSIAYSGLDSYFKLFSVWNAANQCLSWDETVEWAELLGCATVPVLYRGRWDKQLLTRMAETIDTTKQEGYVVRTAAAFNYLDFPTRVGKFVRANHVHTHGHWMREQMTVNGLR